jgi:coproporphyrinogen III oxidase
MVNSKECVSAMRELIAKSFRELQDHICRELESLDGKALFTEDKWGRAEGGGGRTRTLVDGAIIQKGGVAFSEVFGPVTEVMAKQLNLSGKEFYATGVSIVLHPENPFHPIIHMNVRYFELDNGQYWFGGGIDLTPHYIVPSFAGEFHRKLKEVCDAYHPDFYTKFKSWADDYFFLPHRNETRGVGGIFYDHIDEKSGIPKEKLLNFALDLGHLFPKAYGQQINLAGNKEFSDVNIKWRNIRRSRYVEFNLVHDRGTKFGLLSGGRTESILLSMPPQADWVYGFLPEDGSDELNTLEFLKKDVNWVGC